MGPAQKSKGLVVFINTILFTTVLANTETTNSVNWSHRNSKDYKLKLLPVINFDQDDSRLVHRENSQDLDSRTQWLAPSVSAYDQDYHDNRDPDNSGSDLQLNGESKQGEAEPQEQHASDEAEERPEKPLPPALNVSLDRITVLGGLTPLGFLKLMYFLLPFLLPIVFVPLLFVSTAVLMLPVLQVTKRIDKVRHFGFGQDDVSQIQTYGQILESIEEIKL